VAIAFIPPVWAAGLFRREGTEINPTSPTNRTLVTRGPYRFTRNPMYLGLITFALGIAVWVGAWPMFLAQQQLSRLSDPVESCATSVSQSVR
jgi:protein-S-isoprenylcysteine O-methyltransferase Ste14